MPNRATATTPIRARRQPHRLCKEETPGIASPIPPGVRHLLLMLASLAPRPKQGIIVVDGQGEVPYVVDQRNVVARSGFDPCWRTGYWTPRRGRRSRPANCRSAASATKDVLAPTPACLRHRPRRRSAPPQPPAAAPPPARCDFKA